MTLTPDELTRYSRHLSLVGLGIAGQQRLKVAKVLVVGAGGLGSPALLYLAAAGVGTLGIAEFDQVDVSNLQRQVLYDTAQIGVAKSVAARARLLALNPHINVRLHEQMLAAHNVMQIVAEYDVVLDGTDQFATRYLVNDACVLLGKSLVSAAIHRFEGQAFTYVPQRSPCYRCLFPEPPLAGSVANCAEAGVLGVLPGVLGTLQATEAIKLITGIGEPLLGRLLTYDALAMRFDEFACARRTDCAVCGEQPRINADELAARDLGSCDVSSNAIDTQRWSWISPTELQSLLREQAPTLLDVREAHEFIAGHLPAARHVPLASLATATLPTQGICVVMCRSGGRSTQACHWLQQQYPQLQLRNLQGGLLAWQHATNDSLLVL